MTLRCRPISLLALLTLLALTFATALASQPAPFTFTADYLKVFDGADHFGSGVPMVVHRARISGDGNWVVFGGEREDVDPDQYYVCRIRVGGADLTCGATPLVAGTADPAIVMDLDVTQDGSRAFFVTSWWQRRIYRVDFGSGVSITETLVLDGDIKASVSNPTVRTTSNGAWAYFHEDRDDVWRVHSSGAPVERVVDDAAVVRSGGFPGWAVASFDISDDGGEVAFVLAGYWDGGTLHYGGGVPELFVASPGGDCTSPGSCQLTFNDWAESHPAMCGNGSRVGYYSSDPSGWNWSTVRVDGSGTARLHAAGYNVGGVSLCRDGSQMFFYDSAAHGGHLVRTDGSGGIDLFPRWNVGTITLSATWDPTLSNDATRVAFRFGNSIYTGFLNTAPPTSAPSIQTMDFTPTSFDRSDPTGTIILTSAISDPQGLSDITRTATDELMEGEIVADSALLPVRFYFAANDVGSAPDAVAGDGVFTSRGDAGGALATENEVTIRMAAQDSTGHVSVADRVLGVCTGLCELFADDFESGDTTLWSWTIGG